MEDNTRKLRRMTNQEEYGIVGRYMGFGLEASQNMRGEDIIRIVDGYAIIGPEFDSISDAKRYLDRKFD